MEAATAPPPPLTAPPPLINATESIDSSPRSRHGDNLDSEAPQPLPQKLRLMCSYGGHIVPRPHDKTLCYVGGDTRMMVIDRHTSLSSLQSRLSKTLLHNESFSLKYQIPNEDLDSLISVTTDEDLENMVEEYDRLNNAGGGGLKPGRLRLFLFLKSTSNIEQLLVETGSAKSDDWFFNALNGKTGVLSGGASDRGFSETSSINNLLGLDEDLVGKAGIGGNQVERSKLGGNGKGGGAVDHDVHSVPDSPMLESRSSFGSTSSSPSMANLPPIKVRVEENPKVATASGIGIEDQFQQINLAGGGKQEELGVFVSPAAAAAVAPGFPGVSVIGGGEYAANRVFSDDERSERGGYRKVQQVVLQGQAQLTQQPVAPQIQQKSFGGVTDLPSPDSVSSEGSGRNPLSGQTRAVYQEPVAQVQSESSGFTPDIKNWDPNSMKFQMKPQVQEPGYVLSGQYDQNHPPLHQQFVHTGSQYIPAGAVPIASYYHVYAPQQQHHPHQPLLDQQYPFYFVQARGTQAYNLQGQTPAYSDLTQSAQSTRPQAPAGVHHHVAFSPATSIPSSKPEVATGLYKTAAGAAPPSQVMQHQTQFVGFSQIPHPSQSINVNPATAANAPFAYEFADPAHAQIYYSQPLPPQLAGHYQTLAPASAAALANASAQLPAENVKQQVRTLPP